ncbi:MAG: sodium-dependent bicarbonate transport family permease [Pseudomonadota bacterium]
MMEFIQGIIGTIVGQLQTPTLAFLMAGMLLAALGSKIEVPKPVYSFIVMVLLLKIGLGAGLALREASLTDLIVPALGATFTGIAIVLLGGRTLARWRGVDGPDAIATAGLFGAVSASTLAAGMAVLEDAGMAYEGFVGALYPFMDIAALMTAIVLARVSEARAVYQTSIVVAGGTQAMSPNPRAPQLAPKAKTGFDRAAISGMLSDTFRSPPISALLLGLALGLLADTAVVYETFFTPLFKGFLCILMLCMGMEAWSRLSELRDVAHAYLLYGLTAPLIHGLLGFGVGLIAHELTGFSAGGVVLLAVMAASSSDVSGPPTIRAAIPKANPSAYIGSSTGLGTPVAILSIPIWVALAERLIGS